MAFFFSLRNPNSRLSASPVPPMSNGRPNSNGLVHHMRPIPSRNPNPNGRASSKTIISRQFTVNASSSSHSLPGVDGVMMDYIRGRSRATLVAHSLWRHIVQKGDTVIDATCGNGNDTLALLKMVADDTRRGRVYGMDVQKVALQNTSLLLDQSVNPEDKELVELFCLCHSHMGDVIPDGVKVRLVAFNLGYLPGADKNIITKSETTLLAIEAARKILMPGGLISIVAYVGHSGGREEFEKIEESTSRLPFKSWNCCKLQMLNRPLAPVLVFLFKK
ncbi:unnamed protein product [Cuscuta campestris]|uniref:rRNA methylase YtqB n=1 Tax=Cuscuta campestris TaxID=132261 RepID=A0A484MYK6_9ASTE|nr:unnamed protein product [Cuscuta campestris]